MEPPKYVSRFPENVNNNFSRKKVYKIKILFKKF